VFDGLPVDLRAVRAHVERTRAEDPEAGIVIVAEQRSATGLLVAVADQVHLGGIDDITFTTAQ
jgi:biopolymer transport protein ExbD